MKSQIFYWRNKRRLNFQWSQEKQNPCIVNAIDVFFEALQLHPYSKETTHLVESAAFKASYFYIFFLLWQSLFYL